MKILHLKTKWINFLYRVATSSKKFRNLLTPISATFYILFTTLFVIFALQLDIVLNYPKFIAEPINIILAVPIVILGTCISLWSALHFLKVKETPVPINPPPRLGEEYIEYKSKTPMFIPSLRKRTK